MTFYKTTDITKPIQIRNKSEKAPFRLVSKRIYHRKPAWQPVQDGEFTQYKNSWYAVQHDADGDYISVGERLECVYVWAGISKRKTPK